MIDTYDNNLKELRNKINNSNQYTRINVRPIINWLENKRKKNKVEVSG